MSVPRTARAKRGPSSRRSKSSRRTPAPAPFVPGRHDPRDAMRLIARSRVETDLIAAALVDAPPLDRETMGADLYPFNAVASSDRMQAVVEKLVRQRDPDNPWNDVHTAMCKTDQSGHGYATWIDMVRDVSFQCGVDYALRGQGGAVPEWWPQYRQLGQRLRDAVGVMVRYAANAEGGAR